MKESEPKNIKGKIVIVILVLALIGLGVLAWVYRDQLTGSAAPRTTASPTSSTAGVYVPSKDITSDNWVPTPSVAKDAYYTLVDETTPNTTDYLTSNSTGSNNLIFAMKPLSNASGTISQITINVYAKASYVAGVKNTMAVNIGFNGGNWQKYQTSIMGYDNPPKWNTYQYKFTGSWTASDLNNLQVKITTWGGTLSTSVSSVTAQTTVQSNTSPSPSPTKTKGPKPR